MVQRIWVGMIALVALVAPARGQVTLEWKLNEGDKFYVESVTRQKQTIEVLGMKMPVVMDTTNLMSFHVIKRSANEIVLKETIENVKMKGEGPAAVMQEKSADQMKGTVFTIKLTPKGKITKVDGIDDFLKKVAGDNPLVAQMMKTMFSEASVKEMFQEIFAFVPDQPVNENDSWKRGTTLSMGPMGFFNIIQDYTYAGRVPEGERITAKGVFHYETSKEEAGALPFKVSKGEFKTLESTGDFLFDAKAGRLIRSDYKARLKGTMTMVAAGQELPMEMELEQETKMRILDKPPTP